MCQLSDIDNNLDKINTDPNTKKFSLENPKKLGYLITLEANQLEKSIGILNHSKLGEFVKQTPSKIAFLTKASDDSEKLLRFVKAKETVSNIKSVRTSKSFVEQVKQKDGEKNREI